MLKLRISLVHVEQSVISLENTYWIPLHMSNELLFISPKDVTLYALSTITHNYSKDDILRLASVDLDCCLTEMEREQLQEIPLQKLL
jgi:hypothetical protein